MGGSKSKVTREQVINIVSRSIFNFIKVIYQELMK